MKPEVSHDLVKVFTLKIAETILTLESTSASRRLKTYPRKDLSSAACRNVIRTITRASCTSGNLTMLRIGAVRSLIMPMVAPCTCRRKDETLWLRGCGPYYLSRASKSPVTGLERKTYPRFELYRV